jgi:hypothetical protein
MVLFNHFSFSKEDIPSPDEILSEFMEFEFNGGCISKNGLVSDDRVVMDFGYYRPEYLVKIARRIVAEFPEVIPSNYAICASLLRVMPGSEEQEMHQDSPYGSKYWHLFIPLTQHRGQGTTAFSGGLLPPRGCKNYMFDGREFHYGQSNRSKEERAVLVFAICDQGYYTGHVSVLE